MEEQKEKKAEYGDRGRIKEWGRETESTKQYGRGRPDMNEVDTRRRSPKPNHGTSISTVSCGEVWRRDEAASGRHSPPDTAVRLPSG